MRVQIAFLILILCGHPLPTKAGFPERILAECASTLGRLLLPLEPSRQEMIANLEALGYATTVAQNIVQSEPDLALRMLQGVSMRLHSPYEAVTLYRGIRVDSVEEINYTHSGSNFKDDIFFTTNARSTFILAHGIEQEKKLFVAMEVQLPRYMVRSSLLANAFGLSNFYVKVKDLPNMKPFLTRIAIHENNETFHDDFKLNWRLP